MNKCFLTVVFFMMIFSSCSNNKNKFYEIEYELKMIDTLQSRLDEITDWLNKIDIDDIAERKEIIDNNYKFLDNHYRETKKEVTQEISNLVTQYKGLGELYGYTLANHKKIVLETEELIMQLKTLKNSTNSQDYNKETFKEYFKQEEVDVSRLYITCKQVLQSCIVTENDFLRTQEKIEKMVDEVENSKK